MNEIVLTCTANKADNFAAFFMARYKWSLVASYQILENLGGQPVLAVWRFIHLTPDELDLIQKCLIPTNLPPGHLRATLLQLNMGLKEHPQAVGRPDFATVVATSENLRKRPNPVRPPRPTHP